MNLAEVKIWDQTVGALFWDASKGYASFEYEPRFKNLGWELSPLKMPLRSPNSIFSFPELGLKRTHHSSFETFKGLPGLMADMLPDRYGNQLINNWLASQGRTPESMNPVEMLCFIGKRGMGALEFEPAILNEEKRASSLEMESLVETAKKLLQQKEDFHTQMGNEAQKAMLDILKIGTSAGGARPKAVIAWNEKTGEVRSGQTKAPAGFEHWLIKLDGVSDVQLGTSSGYGRVEMAYYKMATAAGIEMMPCRLLEENGRAHFMTKRFDRGEGGAKHHLQTFCGIKHFDFNEVLSFSYEQLFQTMRELQLSYADAEQMFRRLVFNVLARNCDDHTKNFSFLLKKGGHWELAPAYDIGHAYRPGSEWDSQHALSINGKRKDITRKDLLLIGESIRCKKSKEIIQEIEDVVADWPKISSEHLVDKKLVAAISGTFLRLA